MCIIHIHFKDHLRSQINVYLLVPFARLYVIQALLCVDAIQLNHFKAHPA